MSIQKPIAADLQDGESGPISSNQWRIERTMKLPKGWPWVMLVFMLLVGAMFVFSGPRLTGTEPNWSTAVVVWLSAPFLFMREIDAQRPRLLTLNLTSISIRDARNQEVEREIILFRKPIELEFRTVGIDPLEGKLMLKNDRGDWKELARGTSIDMKRLKEWIEKFYSKQA